MRVTIYQPQYFPRLHYFNRILNADVFVLLESAQYTKTLIHETENGRERHKSYQSDTPIKTINGKYLLTVFTKHEGLRSINQTKLEYMHKWKTKHLANINANYKNAPMFQHMFPEIRAIINQEYETLAELNIQTLLWGIVKLLDLKVPVDSLSLANVNTALQKKSNIRLKKIILDTELAIQRPEGLQKGTEWTTEICRALDAAEYLHGGTAQTMYMDLNYYKKNGIVPVIQNWDCEAYEQQFAKVGFIPNLSIIDLLMNVTQKRALQLLHDKRASRKTYASILAASPLLESDLMVFLLDFLGKLPKGITAL